MAIQKNILDKGYIKLLATFGDELTIVNTARVSFNIHHEKLTNSDIKLLERLARDGHWSPCRHVMLRFEIYAPEFVMRQWYKHIVGIETTSTSITQLHGWNELCISRNMNVSTTNGEINIEKLYNEYKDFKEQLLSYDEKSQTIVPNQIVAIYKRYVQEVYRLTTISNNVLDCTSNHQILTTEGWHRLGDLDCEQSVVCQANDDVVYEKIKSIEYIGMVYCYDISMQNQQNFIAGGIVVHNSGRYREIQEFYHPSVWRKQAKINKQGSAGHLEVESARNAETIYCTVMEVLDNAYKELIDIGVAREQARIILPINFYTKTSWTCSLQALFNFLELRDSPHAQEEIRDYAVAMREIIEEKFPVISRIWFKRTNEDEQVLPMKKRPRVSV